MIVGDNYSVSIDGERLNPSVSQRYVNHSPSGFAWGYGGSGPSQLALALLLHYTNDPDYSLRHYQDFKYDIVATLPLEKFTLADAVVTDWIRKHKDD